MGKLNILLTSVGRRSYLVDYFKKALNGQGVVHAANSSPFSPAFNLADQTVVTPLIYDDGYIDFLIGYCKENEIKAVISLFDVDLLVLSQNKDRFRENGISVIVSDEEVITVCNDKWNTYQYLISHGFNAPPSFLTVEYALAAVESGDISFPLIVKPRWGMGSIGLYDVSDEEELRCLFNKVRKDIQKTYLKYESAKTPDNCVIIQQKINGQEYGLDVINNLTGDYINTSVKKKAAMRSGETDCAVTVDKPELKAVGEKLSGCLHHIANLDVDVFVDNEKIYVLEMNARFGGGYPFSHIAGVNLPQAIVNWLLDVEAPKELFEPQIGIMAQKDINMVELNAAEDK